MLFLHCLGAAVLFAASSAAHSEWYSYTDEAMSTRFEMVYWLEPSTENKAVDHAKRSKRIESASRSILAHIEALMSTYMSDSEISRVNRLAAKQPQRISQDLSDVIAQSLRISELSDGDFDITYESIGHLYDLRASKQPSEAVVERLKGQFSYQDVILDATNLIVSFRKPGLRINVGGIAKGYAVERVVDYLRDQSIEHARVSLGGDTYLLGDKRGQPWWVGIKDPRGNINENATVLPLENIAISTSGDYERFFINDQGERVHHILSTRTGKPARGVQSVTVLGDSAIVTDGLSTAVFVKGWARGEALINRIDGYDAIVIDAERKMRYSAGLGVPAEPSVSR